MTNQLDWLILNPDQSIYKALPSTAHIINNKKYRLYSMYIKSTPTEIELLESNYIKFKNWWVTLESFKEWCSYINQLIVTNTR